ncbi:cyclase family protein [Christiangramia sp. SM2212]|uniref:Cyclase family protein n=1 Tax=Christiangramia sediminicola TaxID=3073267 RepID=A0ABU1EN60_9FLAO|nr:cyclase family protein [Christiangramia sp. SM2212]MDR5589819.1 cyclase family protein [Christiangramia sp. SM2212]
MSKLIYIFVLIFHTSIFAQIDTQNSEIIDLTHSFSNETLYWVTAKEFNLEEVAKGRTEKGYYYSANNFETAEHGGTHIDAPIHFAENKQSVDEIPLKKLIGNGIKIDVSEQVKSNPDYQVSVKDITDWEKIHSEIQPQSIILFQTGFGEFYPDAEKYLGTANRGEEALKELHFPGLSEEAALWLIENRNIKAVGLDTASIDHGQSTDFETHVALMTRNIPAFENVANLRMLPDKDFQIIALPIKIKGGSGGPLRIIAIK